MSSERLDAVGTSFLVFEKELRVDRLETEATTKVPGLTKIEPGFVQGRGNAVSLLVQVKSAVEPDTPETLSSDEVTALMARAAQLGFEAWEARVQLDQQLRQVGHIQWRKLS